MATRPGVLITRPEEQLEELCESIAAAGARPVPFPLLRILPLAAPPAGRDPARYRLVIFVSRNAVLHGVPILPLADAGSARSPLVLAVGSGTAQALRDAGVAARVPGQANTEGVLRMAETRDVAGASILIVRGVGGRENLAGTLRSRGAMVEYLEVYERVPAPWTPAQLAATLADEQVQLAIITSGESLEHYSRLLGAADDPTAPVLLLSSPRLVELARELGHGRCLLAEGAESRKLASAVAAWVATAETGTGRSQKG